MNKRTTTPEAAVKVPELTLGWRLKMAIDTGGLTTDTLGVQLGVSGSTVRRWVMDATVPKRAYLLQIALMTNVPAEWLLTGKEPEADLDELEVAGRSDNPEVTNYEAA